MPSEGARGAISEPDKRQGTATATAFTLSIEFCSSVHSTRLSLSVASAALEGFDRGPEISYMPGQISSSQEPEYTKD